MSRKTETAQNSAPENFDRNLVPRHFLKNLKHLRAHSPGILIISSSIVNPTILQFVKKNDNFISIMAHAGTN